MEKNKEKLNEVSTRRSEIIRDFMQSMHTHAHYSHKFMATLTKKMEISLSHESMQVLDVISTHKEGITIKQICEINLKSRMLNWKLIKNLEEKDLIIKKENVLDKRTPLLFLTDKGIQYIEKKISKGEQVFSRMLKGFDDDEVELFTSYFKRVINNIGELVEELDSEKIVHDSIYEILKEDK